MSIEAVREFTETFPPRLRDDVIGYAMSVESALPEIFRDVGIRFDKSLGSQLVFLAAIRKLHAVVSSSFWILHNSLRIAEKSNVEAVRIGPERISRGAGSYESLRVTLAALDQILERHEITELVRVKTYADAVRVLRDER